MMQAGNIFRSGSIVLVGMLIAGAGTAGAQEPPTQPPASPPPSAQALPPVATQPAQPSRVELSEEELLRRRNAIFLMEGLLVNSVRLAASRTQEAIETAQPDLKVTLFSALPPEARGNYLEDYGVFFQVLIPTYQPSSVSILNLLDRQRPESAQPATLGRATPPIPLNPDAVYVETVRRFLTDAMLENSKSLDLRPSEWLTVAARGADGAGGPVSEPSVMILRVKGSDLIEYLSGRLTRDEVVKRVEVRGFSGRR